MTELTVCRLTSHELPVVPRKSQRVIYKHRKASGDYWSPWANVKFNRRVLLRESPMRTPYGLESNTCVLWLLLASINRAPFEPVCGLDTKSLATP